MAVSCRSGFTGDPFISLVPSGFLQLLVVLTVSSEQRNVLFNEFLAKILTCFMNPVQQYDAALVCILVHVTGCFTATLMSDSFLSFFAQCEQL